MWRVTGSETLPPLRWPVVTLGVFDGVHRGHQAVLRQAIAWARQRGGEAVVITFQQHPRSVLRRGAPPLLTALEHRLVLFERLGLDGAVVFRFDRRLAALSARQFVERILVGRLGARGIVFGFNNRFGRGAEGDLALLRQYEAAGEFAVREGRPVRFRGQPISSTAIRDAILAGRLYEARCMLGRRLSVLGTVVRGERRGRTLGHPTANLDLHHEVAPPPGVYATWARMHGLRLPSVTSIGPRPTFDRPGVPGLIEVHLIRWSGRLYGRDVEVQFVRRLRAQRRFTSAAALAEQIARDVHAARSILAHSRAEQ